MGGRPPGPQKPYMVEGVPMTHNAARLANVNLQPDNAKADVRSRNARVIRMKHELNRMLDLVSHSREQLGAELGQSYEASKGIDPKYLKALKELSAIFENLTSSRIRLDKAEKQMEAEMSTADERRAAMEHIMSLQAGDRGQVIKDLMQQHNALVATPGYTPRANPDDVIQVENEYPDEPVDSDS